MLFLLEKKKTTEVNCLWQCAVRVLADLHVSLWVKTRAAHGRAPSMFLFCFSASENWMSWSPCVALCGLEGLCSTLGVLHWAAHSFAQSFSIAAVDCSDLSLAVTSGGWAGTGRLLGSERTKGLGKMRNELCEKLPVVHRQLSTLHLAELVLQRVVSSWCCGWLNTTRNYREISLL